MNWSKIQKTELATEAYVLMNENEIKGCQYHNNSHIEAMYQYLEETGEPYDEALDWAVMFHDVVYDAEPKKEWRSSLAFSEMKDNYRGCNLSLWDVSKVSGLIMATEKHLIETRNLSKNYSAIIRADLHALTSKVDTVNNFTKIMNESMALYDCNIQDFAASNIQFMSGLHARMAINILNVNEDEKLFFYLVQEGINLTIRMAQAIIDTKNA
jgi:predicted metal-dependent HD superfamily phosphohydrolase